MPSIKKNFAWSTILTIAGYIFPFITFPYVTRVLGVEGIGANQFAESTVAYFSIFAMLGTGTVGIREIAKARGNREELSKVFCGLLYINLISTLLAIVALVVCVNIIPTFASHANMLYIGTAKLLCTTLTIEWFFKGLEDFRYITLRAIIIRLFYVVSVFVFVRSPEDYVIYFVLSTLTVVINAIVNLVYAHRFVFFTIHSIPIRRFMTPFFSLGIYLILTQMYGSFNVIFLGANCGDVEVGYYSTTVKLYNIIMSVFSAFTGVMMPRMSSLLSEGKNDEFIRMTTKSIDILLLFCIPLIVFTEVYAPQIIRIIAGEGYEGAILPMRIVMPLMLIIGYEQIIIVQMLMPMGKDNAILTNSVVGAFVALVLNLSLVPLLSSVGTSIVWCSCEVAVAISAQYFVTKYLGYRFQTRKILIWVAEYLPVFFPCLVANCLIENKMLSFFVGIIIVASYFVVVELYIKKTPILLDNIHLILNKAHKRI